MTATPLFPELEFAAKPRRSPRLPACPVYRVEEYKVEALRETFISESDMDTPACIHRFYLETITTDPRHNPEVECMYVLLLNTRRKLRGYHLVSIGTLNTVLTHPREIFRPAIIASASAIVLLHNHPSGDPSPSDADIRVTRDLIRAGQLLRLDLLDHVVTTHLPGKFCSLRELGHFY
ncbi:MAG: JAB domain-containing protein [Verrucomicrobiota bacterium]